MTIYKNALGELVITKAHLTLPMKIAKKRHVKKYPADDFNEHKTKKNKSEEKHDEDEGDGCHSYSHNWYYDMVGKNWEAYYDVYIETHEDEVVVALDDYESQPTRQELFGEDVMTDAELKAHKAKNETDRDAMVRNALSLVFENEILTLEEKAELCCQVVQHKEFPRNKIKEVLQQTKLRAEENAVEAKAKVDIKVQTRGDGMIEEMLSRAF